jgi:dTDP-4-amino-4,6-dideoxygalactose transaminase
MDTRRDTFLPFFKPDIDDNEINAVVDVLKSGWLTTGPNTVKFEELIKEFTGSKHAIAVNSCTAGLHIMLAAIDIQPGDEVITTPFTFTATANVIVHLGGKPVFVDIEEDTYNIDPEKIRKAITPKTKAIMIVHYAGHSCDMEKIMQISNEHKIPVIEDCAHAIDCYYNGKHVGNFGIGGVLSFYANKNLTTAEGGMILTNDDDIAEKAKILSLHGISKDAWKRYSQSGKWYYEVEKCGFKYNLPDILAVIGIEQLKKLKRFQERRKEIVQRYNEGLRDLNVLKLPANKDYNTHAYHIYPIVITDKSIDRNEFIEKLTAENIGLSVHFIPLHLQPYFQKTFGYKLGDFPVAEKTYFGLVTLPLFPLMTNEDVDYVISSIKNTLK